MGIGWTWWFSAFLVLLLVLPAGTSSRPVGRALFYEGSSLPVERTVPQVAPSVNRFAFVSSFENGKFDGWTSTGGLAAVTARPNYDGEPVLASIGKIRVPQTDVATKGFVTGIPDLFFQVAVRSNGGTGFVGLEGTSGPVAVVGVQNTSILAGATPANATRIGSIPTHSAQPAGWVLLFVEVRSKLMDVYADRTDRVLATNVSVPLAPGYLGGLLETTRGTVDYTDIVFTTYSIPATIPGYNPMDGYGQGSGLLVRLLPDFQNLTARETLSNWSTPEHGILSYQINAMNRTGTVRSTCKGFFQLGVDLEPNGRIAPWYVPGRACVPYYFGHPFSWKGFPSPAGTVLLLSIVDNSSTKKIDFRIVDSSVTGANRTWAISVPYLGGAFYGLYTQVEFQPSSLYPIASYFLNGSIDTLRISGGSIPSPAPPSPGYMLPYTVNLPPSWNMNYYNATSAGYVQVA